MPHLPRNTHGQRESDHNRRYSNLARLGRPAVLLLTFGALLAGGSAEPHHVTAVRFWLLGSVTRIAVETDGNFELRWDRLDNPDRIFFDLMDTRPALSEKSITVIPVHGRFVRQIRVAEPQHNVTRVVLDMESPAEFTTSRLDSPSRLIIELHAAGRAPEPTPPPETTTKAPARSPSVTPTRSPSVIDEPTPARKAIEHRPFTPPPTPQPAASPIGHPEDAMLESPPRLQTSVALPSLPTLFTPPDYVPGPVVSASATAVLAKPEPAPLTSANSYSNVPAPAPRSSFETAYPAKRNSSGDRSMIRALGLKVDRIVLDPGHGGHDTGTVGPGGLREKDLVLDVALRLGHLIEQRMGSEVIYTRTDDTFVPLERRTEIANEAKADLFLSIHANSSPFRSAAGVETYYLNFTTSKSALDLAARENAGSQMSIYDLQGLLEKIVLKDKVEESREFAVRIQNALYAMSARPTDARSKNRGVKKAPFVVLIGASMPSVLAEIGFVSNAHDENIMRREDYRERTAEALYKGISNYANSLSHFQVAQRR